MGAKSQAIAGGITVELTELEGGTVSSTTEREPLAGVHETVCEPSAVITGQEAAARSSTSS